MSVASAAKIAQISQAKDPRRGIIDAIGDLSKIDVFADLVLVGTFIRNEKTKSGLYLPTEHLKEDEYQGKVGLVLKTGPLAFGDWEDDALRGQNAKLHSWVVFSVQHGWSFQINGVACRVVSYDKLRMRTDDPTLVF